MHRPFELTAHAFCGWFHFRKEDIASGTSKQMKLVRRNWCQISVLAQCLRTINQTKEFVSGNKDKKIGQSYKYCILIARMAVATPTDNT